MCQQRCGNDEDNQQYEHYVDQRHYIDFSHRQLAIATVYAAKCHYDLRSVGATAGEMIGATTRSDRSSPAELLVFVPTAINTKRSCAKESRRASHMRLRR